MTKYTSSNSVRKKNLSQFVEKMRGIDPAGAKKMQDLFSSTDIIASISDGIAPYGLKANDVADAYTAYWMTAWQAVHADSSGFTRNQSLKVKYQAASALLQTQEFIDANDPVR
jgi:hypothetical protein